MSLHRDIRDQAKKLLRLSLDERGDLSAERVSGVLAALKKYPPRGYRLVLRAYHRVVERELRKSEAMVEHAGEISKASLQKIADQLTAQYERTISVQSAPNPKLLAGLRVRIGDDVYDSSLAGRLHRLEARHAA